MNDAGRRLSLFVQMQCITTVCAVGGVAFAGPVGRAGLSADYRLDADRTQRPEHELKNNLTVVDLTLTVGATAQYNGETFQWFQLAFAKANGRQYTLRVLLDRLPTDTDQPRIARYLWHEPQWETPLEYVDKNTGWALLPRIPFWVYAWPTGLRGVVNRETDFPERLSYLGYPFKRTAVRADGTVSVPDSKVLRLDPDTIIYTVDSFRYLPLSKDDLPKETLYSHDKYRMITADDFYGMKSAGQNLFNSHHAWRAYEGKQYGPVVDVWREEVFVFDHPWDPGTRNYVWPEPLYRSNYYGCKLYLNEPGAIRSGVFNSNAKVIASWTPQQLARDFESHVRSLMTEKGGGLWRKMAEQYGLGRLKPYVEPTASWDVPFENVWHTLAAGAGGYVREKMGLGTVSHLAKLNMEYQAEIPMTAKNIFALNTAILRGAARSFDRPWGISIYARVDPPVQVAGLEYAYRHGATFLWFWGGWPNIDEDWLHAYKLYFMNAVHGAAEHYGTRDMERLRHQAKVAIALPYGYGMDPLAYGYMMRTPWMHAERKNKDGVTIRTVLRNAYTEAERLLRDDCEFDIVVSDKCFNRAGYEEIITIQEDGKVRVWKAGAETLYDGPRMPVRPDLGERPKISLTVAKAPQTTGQSATLKAVRTAGSAKFVGRMRWLVYAPNGLAYHGKKGVVAVSESTERWKLARTEVPGTYRIRVSTIDEFSRSAEAWAEFTLHGPRNRKGN